MWSKHEISELVKKALEAGAVLELTDSQVVSLLSFEKSPASDVGGNVMNRVKEAVFLHADKKAPVRLKVFEKQWPEKKFEVFLFSNEGKLAGPDAFDELYLFKGNVYSVPPTPGKELQIVKEKGSRITSFVEAFAARIGAGLEELKEDFETIEMSRIGSLEQANIMVPKFLKKFIKTEFIDADVGLHAELRVV